MADNYLEKRMEEYRSGRLASRSRTSASMRAPRKNNQLTLAYPSMTVVIFAGALDGIVDDTVAAFAAVGCRVAFTADDGASSARLAQRTGARFYPSAISADDIIADISARWSAPDVALFFTPVGEAGKVLPTSVRMIDAQRLVGRHPDVSASMLARHLLYLSHPDNAFLID